MKYDHIKYHRIKITLNNHTFHMDFEQPMLYSEIDAFLEKTYKEPVAWHPEARCYDKHYPIYLNRLDEDAFQIYGQMNGFAVRQERGPQQDMFITNIKFFDYYNRLVKQTLMPTYSMSGLYDTLVKIYEDEIINPPCDVLVRYHLYVFVNENHQINYIRERLMDDYENAPKLKDRVCNLSDLGHEINGGWGPSVQVPQDEGVYQMVVQAKWSPLQARILHVLSCTPICLF